jgi:uncharacterized membrane protein YhaH (DUF805 family)
MTFAEALQRCFNLCFTFSGRASRPEYWWFVLFYIITLVTLALISALSLPAGLGGALITIFIFAMAIPLLAVSFRRLQDTGRSGWFTLTPIVGAAVASGGRLFGSEDMEFAGMMAETGIAVVLLWWYASDGTRGPNLWGPDPTGRRGAGRRGSHGR